MTIIGGPPSTSTPSSTPSSTARRIEQDRRQEALQAETPTPEARALTRGAAVEAGTEVTAQRGEAGQALLDTKAARPGEPALPPVAATSTEALYTPPATTMAPAEKPAEKIGFFGQVAGVATGAWGGVTDLAGGLKDMGVGAVNLTGLRGEEARAQTKATLAQTADTIVNNPGAIVDGITKPVTEPWQQGRYGEAIGRGIFEAAGVVFGTKGVDKLGKLSTVGRAADTIADTARAAERIADPVADAARIARANEVLPVTSASVAAPGMGSTKLHFIARELKAEVMHGTHAPIAGAGTSTPLRVADDLARRHGGLPEEWQKVTSTQRGVRMDGSVVPGSGQTTHAAPAAANRPTTVDPYNARTDTAMVANFEVHAYRNTRTGAVVEPKLIAEVAPAAPKITETGKVVTTPKERFEIRDLGDF